MVCVPVETRPRADIDASGIFRVNVPPRDVGEPDTLTSVPDVPIDVVKLEFAN
jgi:hypothetical protein